MQDYTYHGCVMAVEVADSGLPDVLLPNSTITADEAHPYIKRLVARGILKTAEAIGCIPTSLIIDNQTLLSGSEYSLTFSVNEGQPITSQIQADSTVTPAKAFENILLGCQMDIGISGLHSAIPLAGDGGGLCFLKSPYYMYKDSNPTIQFSGFATSEGEPAANSLTLYPTNNLPTGQDLYPLIAGANPSPSLTIHSCAVFQKMGI